ncbi:hypothetical protein LSCM1_04398 [Leishmania martiniquensis]|uniref:Uncharacterized protein n=1 Tax=Leishmania martiniquensis TaxID=1580590 RepID=A0A836KPV3_9TRYP|nr:hypothetical protein LSCM1_04398 [Leishmania martiniquensis]
MPLSATLFSLRPASSRGARWHSLCRRLRHLRQTNRAAEEQLRERRRLQHLLREEQRGAGATGGSSSGASAPRAAAAELHAPQLLPRNDALEAAIALSISENRDARTDLELVRRLVNSTLLSLASPVDQRWDPYDVKPQVFALDNYIALPVFTSLDYLRLFCQRFGLTVRDPSGVVWASGSSTTASAGSDFSTIGLLPDALLQSEWWRQRQQQQQQQARPPSEVTAPLAVSQEGRSGRETGAKAAPADSEQTPKYGSTGVAATAVEHIIPDLFPASDAAHAAPPAPLDDTPIDPEALFDTTLMCGTVEADGGALNASRAKRRVAPVKEAARSRVLNHPRRGEGKARGIDRKRASSKRRRAHGQRLCKRPQAAAGTSGAAAPHGERAAGVESAKTAVDEAKAAYWESVAQTAPFRLKQATPLPMFGPFLHPFLVGYFADVSTLLHNASIVPEKVDIVLNPASPLEFVLARAATDRVLHKEQLLHHAYLRVEKELQREFSLFFAACCPEVISASSACVPLPMNADEVSAAWKASERPVSNRRRRTEAAAASLNELQAYRERTRLLREAEYRNGVAYELVLLIRSTSMGETFAKMQHAKHQSALMGHTDLDVLPEFVAAPHVREMAHRFYDGASERERRMAWEAIAARQQRSADAMLLGGAATEKDGEAVAEGSGKMGVFVRRGARHTINVAQPPDSFFHAPENTYTEAHAVFTEDLKVNRGQ